MKLAIVIPCYNEQSVLPETHRRISVLLRRLIDAGKISPDSQAYFVDDGSTDYTWNLIETMIAADIHVVGIKLSRNRGHQNALIAGLFRPRATRSLVLMRTCKTILTRSKKCWTASKLEMKLSTASGSIAVRTLSSNARWPKASIEC